MLALEIKNNLTPVAGKDFFHPQITRSADSSLMKEERKKSFTGKSKLGHFSSMGIVMPFQPSMWDDKTIDSAFENAIRNLKQKMKAKYTNEIISALANRVVKLFSRLNFNTHRKSLAIILTRDKEKIIYLNFPVKPVIFFAKNISALDLATNIQQEASFFYLILNKNKAELYDFNSGRFQKVYEEFDKCDFSAIFHNVVKVIALLNNEIVKPAFVTGSPHLVELFCNNNNAAGPYYPLLYDSSPFSKKIIQSVVNEIASHWDYWRSKSISDKILLAQQANRIISNIESVLHALNRSMDGILLLDKKLKRQLQKPFHADLLSGVRADLNTQIERFLIRGNQVEITETRLLRGFSGIALLPVWKTPEINKVHHAAMLEQLL